jgi:hypothetical protein
MAIFRVNKGFERADPVAEEKERAVKMNWRKR